MEAEAEEEVRGGAGAGLGFSFSSAPQWAPPFSCPCLPFLFTMFPARLTPGFSSFSRLPPYFPLVFLWACPSHSHLILSPLGDRSPSGPTLFLSPRTKSRLRLHGLWIRVGVY